MIQTVDILGQVSKRLPPYLSSADLWGAANKTSSFYSFRHLNDNGPWQALMSFQCFLPRVMPNQDMAYLSNHGMPVYILNINLFVEFLTWFSIYVLSLRQKSPDTALLHLLGQISRQCDGDAWYPTIKIRVQAPFFRFHGNVCLKFTLFLEVEQKRYVACVRLESKCVVIGKSNSI